MKRAFSFVLALAMMLSIAVPVSHAQEVTDCDPDIDEPFACRGFEAPLFSADVFFLQIIVSDHSTPSQAEGYVLNMAEEMEGESLPQLRLRGLPDGTDYLYTSAALEEDGSSMGIAFLWVSFEQYVIILATVGNGVPESDDLVTIVTDMIDNAQTADGDLLAILPTERDIPYSMSLASENVSTTAGNTSTTGTTSSSGKVSRTPRNTSGSSSTTSSEPVTRTPRNTSSSSTSSSSSSTSSRSSTSSGGLRVVDVTSRDAGIGDGTIYVYIELENNSQRSYDYVQVDIVCRDRNDRVVATGLANELGLPAGGSTVLTGIVLSAPDCVRIQTQINPISN